jgi:hypothetical protein
MPRLVHKTSVERETTKPHSLSMRLTEEAYQLLQALQQHDPPIKQARVIEEGIRLVARRYKVKAPQTEANEHKT